MFRVPGEITRTPLEKGPDTSTNESIQCEYCEETSPTETVMVCHKRKHSHFIQQLIDVDCNICLTCIKEYPTKAELHKHIRSRHFLSSDTAIRIEREIFICNECEAIFFNKSMLAYHLAHSHKCKFRSQTSDCPKCMQHIHSRLLKHHFLAHFHYRFTVETCPICILKFKNCHECLAHVEIIHEKHYHCTICGYSTIFVNDFNKHCLMHNQKTHRTERPSQELLNRFFVPTKRIQWKYNNWSYVPQTGLCIQSPFTICILCREICENYKAMFNHLMSHEIQTKSEPIYEQVTKEIKKKFICECGADFDFKILLKQHQIKCDKRECVTKSNGPSIQKQKKFSCKCGQNFENSVLLKRHQIKCKTKYITKCDFRSAKQDSQSRHVTNSNNASVHTVTMGDTHDMIILSDTAEAQDSKIAIQKSETPTFSFTSSKNCLDTDCYETQPMKDICEIKEHILPDTDPFTAQSIIIKNEQNILPYTPSQYQDTCVQDIIIEVDISPLDIKKEKDITPFTQEITPFKQVITPFTHQSQSQSIQNIVLKQEKDILPHTDSSEIKSIEDINIMNKIEQAINLDTVKKEILDED